MKSRARFQPAVTVLLLCILLTACGKEAKPPEAQPQPSPSSEPISKPSPAPTPEYPEVRVYYDSLLSDKGIFANDTLYMAPEAICAYAGLTPETEIIGDSFKFSVQGLELKGAKGQEYMEALSRYFYTPEFYIEHKGRIYLPQDVLERVFGVKFEFDPEAMRAELTQSVVSLMQGGENYYIENFPAEDHYWLSRIIYAEAKDQPMAGLIGVGNVVYNRVASKFFPHTVLDVIYERDKTIQFDPTAAGALGEPDERSLIAASLCMEGYNTVGDCLYFVNPDRGDDTWFRENLEFVMSLGDHDFYRSEDNA